MLKEKEFPVYGDNGLKGTLLSAARFLDPSPEKRVRLEDGRVIMVPSNTLIPQPDGSYYLRPPSAEPERSVPAAAEPSRTEPRNQPETKPAEAPRQRQAQPEGQASSEPAVEQQPAPRQVFAPSAAGPLFREDCEVERVQIKRMLDQPAEIRQDGDTLIIPLMEEVLVVEKRLMLREELHVRRRRETKADNDRVPVPFDQLPR